MSITITNVLLCFVSDGSKKMEADIPVSYTESLFSKPLQSGMADELPYAISSPGMYGLMREGNHKADLRYPIIL